MKVRKKTLMNTNTRPPSCQFELLLLLHHILPDTLRHFPVLASALCPLPEGAAAELRPPNRSLLRPEKRAGEHHGAAAPVATDDTVYHL